MLGLLSDDHQRVRVLALSGDMADAPHDVVLPDALCGPIEGVGDFVLSVAKGAFREDLYCCLAVFDISLPPPRERIDDIAVLSDAFVAQIGRSIGHPRRNDSRSAYSPDAGFAVGKRC